jgi:CPA2 family monovalent cation:H+ antiporter-2
MHASLPLITTFALAFGLALLFGYAAERLKSPALVGYLLAGIVASPYAGLVNADLWLASQLAEIGVMLLMFGVGLHFSIDDLMRVKAIAVPGALMQMISAIALWGCFAFFVWDWSAASSLIFGLCLSCASTVVLLKALELRGQLSSRNGQIAVGWLVVQDIATVVILVLLPPIAEILGTQTGAPQDLQDIAWKIAVTFFRVFAFVALMLIVARRLIPMALQHVVNTESRELFTLSILAIAICIAFVASEVFEVSFALGAFFAGVVVQETKFARRATEDSHSMRDAFSVLFFVSVGMMLDWHVLLERPLDVLCVLGIIMAGNALIAGLIVFVLRYPVKSSLTIGACLSQIGEFSYILAAQGISLRMVGPEVLSLIVAASILSIALNPLMFCIVEPLDRFLLERFSWARRASSRKPEPPRGTVTGVVPSLVLVVGSDKAAYSLAKSFTRAGMPVVCLTENHDLAEELSDRSLKVIEGKASDRSKLEQVDIATTSMAFLSGLSFDEGREVITMIRETNSSMRIAVRTTHAEEVAMYAEYFPSDLVLFGKELQQEQKAAASA